MIRPDLNQWTASQSSHHFDVVVVGGGATGLGVAVQAALEGRRIALIEGRDFASGTSSRSTKLLHGGVRYLAQGQFRLIQEALRERSIMLKLAPHLAQPIPFVVAERKWSSWLVSSLGLNIYQMLSRNLSLGPTAGVSSKALHQIAPTLPPAAAGVRYWDGQFDDARYAIALAQTANAAGAMIRNHTLVTSLQNNAEGWTLGLRDSFDGTTSQIRTRCVVNATGVWVDDLRHQLLTSPKTSGGASSSKHLSDRWVQPSQGVHLVVSLELLPLNEAVLVPRTRDGRVLFAMPWLGSIVIGTTDTPRNDAPLEPRPYSHELKFLFEESHRHLGVKLHISDIKSVWAGLRPLVNRTSDERTTSQISREHLIVREQPGFITVTGGKWTTYRSMAELVMKSLVESNDLPASSVHAQTQNHALKGAPAFATHRLRDAPSLNLYGTASAIIQDMTGPNDTIGLGLTEHMVRYSARNDWAVTVEDMLARRWRALFLDARMAKVMAPKVARYLQAETGINPQLHDFEILCDQYTLSEISQGHD